MAIVTSIVTILRLYLIEDVPCSFLIEDLPCSFLIEDLPCSFLIEDIPCSLCRSLTILFKSVLIRVPPVSLNGEKGSKETAKHNNIITELVRFMIHVQVYSGTSDSGQSEIGIQ